MLFFPVLSPPPLHGGLSVTFRAAGFTARTEVAEVAGLADVVAVPCCYSGSSSPEAGPQKLLPPSCTFRRGGPYG